MNAQSFTQTLSQTFFAIVLFCVATLISSCSSSSNDNNNSDDEPLVLQDILDQTISYGAKGIFVYIQTADQPAILATSGIQNDTSGELADSRALFKIASISKLFIAVSTIKLTHQGTLTLSDTLQDWLPELSSRIENSEAITIRQLLQHRSGIPDFDSQTGFSWSNSHTDIDDTLEYALDLPADFAPNERYEYSNTNYLLLGKILDRALNYDHRIYIQDTILTPNQLFDTYSLLEEIDISLLARGYWNGNDVTELSYSIPGGSMISTSENIGVFIRELATGNLLSFEERSLYREVFSSFEHSGWLPGYQSIARYSPNLNTVIIQFMNSTGANTEALAQENYNKLLLWVDQQTP
ncbi:MAG: beta-lactamase family protein [Gammaproteobacteria bacterium]|nr:beta-lactamase family protein [Gammaproteobacteria bacterium]